MGLMLKIGVFVGKGSFPGFQTKIRVLIEKLGFLWKNDGFFEKWGFHGFLVKKSAKIREEPGI